MLKSQDVLVALKLTSLALQSKAKANERIPVSTWRGWEEQSEDADRQEIDVSRFFADNGQLRWTYADLFSDATAQRVGVQCGVKRGLTSGLLSVSLKTSQPRPAPKQLLEFIVHGLKYVFPAKEGRLARGVATAFGAPVLKGKMLTAGEHEYVWEDAQGLSTGLSIEPLHKSVPFAVRADPVLYELLALIDAIRFGKARENTLATESLSKRMMSI